MPLSTVPSPAPASKARPLPLQAGDHLSASGFLRRYEAAGDQVQAELIDGVVYIMLPAHFEAHGKPDSILSMWLSHYAAFTSSWSTPPA
jgi:hypothetical protein